MKLLVCLTLSQNRQTTDNENILMSGTKSWLYKIISFRHILLRTQSFNDCAQLLTKTDAIVVPNAVPVRVA